MPPFPLPLETREHPTTLAMAWGDDPLAFWSDVRGPVAASVASALSAKIDVPGYDWWRVELGSDPHTPVIAYGTGIDGFGYVRVGPAAVAYDLPTVLRHEMAHTLGVLAHSDDPAAVLWPSLTIGEVRDWTAGDDVLFRQSGLIVVEPAEAFAKPPVVPPVSPAVPPYTEANPYTGALVGVAWEDGWALLPPRVAAAWAGK